MQKQLTLVVDESGEAGINRIRSEGSGGASPYLTMGAALFIESNREHLVNKLNQIGETLRRPDLHCSKLTHEKKVYFARELVGENIRLFGLISRKEKLKDGYKERIEGDDKKFYNKCAIYLLECVGHYMKQRGIPRHNLDIVFEKGNFDYSALKNFVRACQARPLTARAKLLKYIDASRIKARPKEEDECLRIADLVAHALYKCVDKTNGNFGIPETRYLKELESRFYGNNDKDGTVLGYGLKAIHNVKELDLDEDVAAVIEGLKAQN